MSTDQKVVLPGAVFVIATWYKTFETARRISTFFMIAVILNGFSGIVSIAGLALKFSAVVADEEEHH